MSRLFSYVDYDRMSDDIYYIGGSGRYIMRMNVSFAKKMDDGTRRHFYHEYQYDSKYKDIGQVVSIRRSYDYYLTIESYEDKDKLNGIMIRPQDMILLRIRLGEVLQWYSNNEVFAIKKNKIVIIKHPSPIVITGLPERKTISFEPIIINYESVESLGVRMTLNGNIYSDINLDRFYGFVYIINSFDMVASAQMMLAYMGRPESGTNRVELDRNYIDEDGTIPEPKIAERKLPTNKKKVSFFDRVDGLGE